MRRERPCYGAAMTAEERGQALRTSPVFGHLSAQEIESLAAPSREVECRARDYVFMEGDPAEWLCIVRTGRIRIVRHSRSGKDVVLELLGPGEIFGGVAVIEKRPYPAAAQAMEASVVLKIPAQALITVSERNPSVIRELALMMGRRLRSAHDSMKSLAVDPVEARLASTLLRLAERDGQREKRGLVLPFHLTRQSLADMCGTTVETTIRVMSRWSRDGLVLDDDGRLIVADVERLRTIAVADA
jgi:CRP/FNR family transcriptional regulator, nitrogen oxide reductase regulator